MAKLFINKTEIQAKTGLTLIFSFFVLFLANSLVILVANRFFPSDIVLGTSALSLWWAIYHSMTKLTLITTFVIPLVYYQEWKRGKVFSPKEWMLVYFAVNVAALWAISRFADNLGLGISHWWVVLILGAILDWVQGFAMMTLNKYLPR